MHQQLLRLPPASEEALMLTPAPAAKPGLPAASPGNVSGLPGFMDVSAGLE